MTDRQPYEIAMTYLGCPFLHMGRSRTGLDCVGLLILTAREWGINPVDNPYYGREPNQENNAFDLAHYIERNTGSGPVERDIQVNDILLMRLKQNTAPSHLALAAPHPHGMGMVHTYGEIGKVVFHRINETRMAQIVGVYPWPVKV